MAVRPRFPRPTPHKCRRHITHQMWCTTFYAVVPHVRFDERRQETEPCQPGLRECAKATPTTHRAANVTAPVVDSTREPYVSSLASTEGVRLAPSLRVALAPFCRSCSIRVNPGSAAGHSASGNPQ